MPGLKRTASVGNETTKRARTASKSTVKSIVRSTMLAQLENKLSHYSVNESAMNTDAGPYAFVLPNISAGPDADERDGNKILFTKYHIRGHFITNATAQPSALVGVRFILLRVNGLKTAAEIEAKLFEGQPDFVAGTDFRSLTHMINRSYKVMWDLSTYVDGLAVQSARPVYMFNKTFRINNTLIYNDDTSILPQNYTYVMYVLPTSLDNDSAATPCEFTCTFAAEYKDL